MADEIEEDRQNRVEENAIQRWIDSFPDQLSDFIHEPMRRSKKPKRGRWDRQLTYFQELGIRLYYKI